MSNYKELLSNPAIEPESEKYISYNINALKQSHIPMKYSPNYVEINFLYKECSNKNFENYIKYKSIIPDGKFKLAKFTLHYLLHHVRNIPNNAEVLLSENLSKFIFKNEVYKNLEQNYYYSYRVFDLRSYFNNLDSYERKAKKLKFVPNAVNYYVIKNFITPIFGVEPKYDSHGRYEYFIRTNLKFLTHIKCVKNLDEGSRIRLKEEQKNKLF